MAMTVNENIGNATTPMVITHMVTSRIGEVPYEKGMREVLPFLFALLKALALFKIFQKKLCGSHALWV